MDYYPGVPQCAASFREARSGMVILFGGNLKVSKRPMTAGTYWDPAVCHRHVGLADLNTILDFETAHRGVPFKLRYIPESEDYTDPDGGLITANLLEVVCVFSEKGIDALPISGFNPVVFDVTSYLIQKTLSVGVVIGIPP